MAFNPKSDPCPTCGALRVTYLGYIDRSYTDAGKICDCFECEACHQRFEDNCVDDWSDNPRQDVIRWP